MKAGCLIGNLHAKKKLSMQRWEVRGKAKKLLRKWSPARKSFMCSRHGPVPDQCGQGIAAPPGIVREWSELGVDRSLWTCGPVRIVDMNSGKSWEGFFAEK